MTVWHPCHEKSIHGLVYMLQVYDIKYVDMYLELKIIQYNINLLNCTMTFYNKF